jgi:hypothetical protein
LIPRLPIAIKDRDALRSAIRGACLAAKQQWAQALSYLQVAWQSGCRDIVCLRWYCTTLFALDSADELHSVLIEWEQLGTNSAELQKFASVCLAAIKESPTEKQHRIDGTHPVHAPALGGEFVAQGQLQPSLYPAW